MRLSTTSLARESARHPKRTLALWGIALLLAIGAIVTSLGDVLTTEGEVKNNPESEQGYAELGSHFPPSDDYVNELVVVRSRRMTVDDAAFRERVELLAAGLAGTGYTASVHTFYETHDRSSLSHDRHATVLTVGLGPGADAHIEAIVDEVQAADGDGFETAITGEWTLDHDFTKLSEDDLRTGELQFGLPAALLVLLLVFGSVVAGLVPVVLALVAIIVALGLTAIIGQFTDLSVYVLNMVTVMGLALGADYSLFILSRYREERRHAREKLDAIAISGATASRAVFFSGTAFVLAMLGMVLVPDTILRSLALGAIAVGISAVAAALTLLPAVLSVAGDGINALRIPWLGRRVEASAGAEGRIWSRVVKAVMRRPALFCAVSFAFLLACAVPALDLTTGEAGVRALPDRFAAKQGFLALERSFGLGTVDTVQVVVGGDVESRPVQAAIRRLASSMSANPAFRPPETSVSPDGQVALVESLVAGDSRDARTVEAVERLRSEDVPAAFGASAARVWVTGETAEVIDYRALTSHWLPIVFAFVLSLSFVLLLVAFRSVVVAAKAIILNWLSVTAAYGLMVLVFQKGVGNELLGFEQVDAIAAWLPLFLFSVLFGLSMDYHVFLLSRIRERVAHGASTTDAVAHGVSSTARMITGAALVIIVVFVGFATSDLVEFQQTGFGVAVALLIDATLIRLVLLPASMTLLGKWNWYLPGWLEWLPHLEIEGARPMGA